MSLSTLKCFQVCLYLFGLCLYNTFAEGQSPPLSSPEATEGAAGEETNPVGDSSEFSHRTSLSSAISSAEDISPQVSSGWSW